MYFSKAKKIEYGDYIVTDITRRTNIIQELIKNEDFYFNYLVKSGDTPETVAYDFWGNPYYHWIIFLVNEIYDPLYQWYMTYNEVVEYAKLKYGDPTYQQTQYWLFQEVKYKTQPDITVDPNGLAVAVSNLDVEIERNDNNQTIKMVYPEYIKQIVWEYEEIILK
jgi:hypothetical protein